MLKIYFYQLKNIKLQTKIDGMCKISLSYIVRLIAAIFLTSCSLKNGGERGVVEVAWLNPLTFEKRVKTDGYFSDIVFSIEFIGSDDSPFVVESCDFILQNNANVVAEREYHRWQWLNDNCFAASKFFDAPKEANSFLSEAFDYELIKNLPATSIPNIGNESLDGRIGTLYDYDDSLRFVNLLDENRISVEVDNLDIYYTQVARADFNRDGYQDLFIRMDWYVKDAFGKGTDWIVLTRLGPNLESMILWRK